MKDGTGDLKLTTVLTAEELRVIEMLAAAYNLFVQLSAEHPMEHAEFATVVHQAQRMVMARPVRRALLEAEERDQQ